MQRRTQLGEVIRGHAGTITFDGARGRLRHRRRRRSTDRPRLPAPNQAGGGGEHVQARAAPRRHPRLWEHFLECVRSRNPETLCPAETGYAAIATVNLGVQSYREGKAFFFDKETGKVSEADDLVGQAVGEAEPSTAASRTRSSAGTPATEGSLLEPPGYQKLEGDWIDGKDPAEKA